MKIILASGSPRRRELMEQAGIPFETDASEAVMVGDQVFTDVIAGRLAPVYTIMVEKYSSKEIWYVVLKRPFEKLVRLIGRF